MKLQIDMLLEQIEATAKSYDGISFAEPVIESCDMMILDSLTEDVIAETPISQELKQVIEGIAYQIAELVDGLE